MRRTSRLVTMTALVIATATTLAPTALGVSRLDVDVTLPAAFSISGRIMNEAGVGLAGVLVNASGLAGSHGATTNGSGAYTVLGLEPGAYQVRVRPPNTTNYRYGYYGEGLPNNYAADGASATDLTLGPSKTGIDIRLPVGYSIRGKVTNTAGTGLAEVKLVTFATEASTVVSTDGAGDYVIRGLPPGSFKLQIAPPAGPNILGGYYSSADASGYTPTQTAASAITVGPSRTGIDITLPGGFTIRGRITDTANLALRGVSVSALGPGHGSAVTNASGDYTITALKPGSYSISVQPGALLNYRDGFYDNTSALGYTTDYASATGVNVGPSQSGVNVKLPAGFMISGRITNAAGTGIAAVSVVATSSRDGGTVTTSSTGAFVIRGLHPANYRLEVRPRSTSNYRRGYYTNANVTHFSDTTSGATTIAVGPSKSGIVVRLPAGYRIGDSVRGGDAPLGGVQVFAFRAGAIVRAVKSDSTGRYLIQGLAAGTYRIQFEPAEDAPFLGGWYQAGVPGKYTSSQASASGLTIGP